MWWPSGWPLIPSRLFSHLHLLVAAQAGLEFVCVFGHDGLTLYRQPTSLVVREAKLPPAKPSFEDSVLFE